MRALSPPASPWIGLTYVNNRWEWINGEIAAPAAILWGPGEPTHNYPCVHARHIANPNDDWGWASDDFPCHAIQRGVCEKPYYG